MPVDIVERMSLYGVLLSEGRVGAILTVIVGKRRKGWSAGFLMCSGEEGNARAKSTRGRYIHLLTTLKTALAKRGIDFGNVPNLADTMRKSCPSEVALMAEVIILVIFRHRRESSVLSTLHMLYYP